MPGFRPHLGAQRCCRAALVLTTSWRSPRMYYSGSSTAPHRRRGRAPPLMRRYPFQILVRIARQQLVVTPPPALRVCHQVFLVLDAVGQFEPWSDDGAVRVAEQLALSLRKALNAHTARVVAELALDGDNLTSVARRSRAAHRTGRSSTASSPLLLSPAPFGVSHGR